MAAKHERQTGRGGSREGTGPGLIATVKTAGPKTEEGYRTRRDQKLL